MSGRQENGSNIREFTIFIGIITLAQEFQKNSKRISVQSKFLFGGGGRGVLEVGWLGSLRNLSKNILR